MISEPIKEKEWKKITNDSEAHIKKLVKPVRDENNAMKLLGKDSYEKLQKFSSRLGFGNMPSFDDITSIDDSHFSYYRILNKIKQDCIYLDWNASDWFSFFYLPIKKQQAFANCRLIYTKRIILSLIIRNRLHQLLNSASGSKKLKKEILFYRQEIFKIEKIIKSKKFERYANDGTDLLKQYDSLRLKQYVIEQDDEKLTFTLNHIHTLPDMFFELYVMTGMLPEKILTLKKQDIDLEKHAIASDFDGCEVCQKQRESDLSIWRNHFLTNEHLENIYLCFKSKFKLKSKDPALVKLKNIISARRSKGFDVY